MRRLIESLAPGERPLSWKLIGSVLAFYVTVATVAISLLMNHQPRANLAHEAGATVAAGKVSVTQTRSLVPQLAGFTSN